MKPPIVMQSAQLTTDSDRLCCQEKAAQIDPAKISLIVPVGPGEESWEQLLKLLVPLRASFGEVWLIGTSREPVGFENWNRRFSDACLVHWVHSTTGRGQQLNTGARLARGNFLWFLHADSKVTHDTVSTLKTALETDGDSIYFFDLKYENDGPAATRLNEWGVWVRSHWFRLPFGDQGFAMSRDTFERLGGFRENASFGEDHLFIWQAHRQRIPLRAIPASIITSARKYRSNGWFKTTLLHLWRSGAQALPQAFALIWNRIH